jgi:hypothetical protein
MGRQGPRAKGAAKIIALKVRSGQPFETREFQVERAGNKV